MKFQYEISEKDFLNGQDLAIKHSPIRYVRWRGIVLPLFGLVLLGCFIYVMWQQGFSASAMPALVIPLVFLCLPLLNRRAQKKMYAKNTTMRGRLSLEANYESLRFSGESFNSTVSWSIFNGFAEDDRSFVLYQNSGVCNIVPKRLLPGEQVSEFSDLCRRHLKLRD